MREYEFTFVVQPEISDDGIAKISERFEGILAENDSEKLFYEDWGRRRLAYEIRNFQKGHYRVLHFLSDGKVIPTLERSARLDDSVLRFLTVQADDDVADIQARRTEAAALEEERIKRAAEKAARDAEEAQRAADEAARAEAERERIAAMAEAASNEDSDEPEQASEATEASGEDASSEASSEDSE